MTQPAKGRRGPAAPAESRHAYRPLPVPRELLEWVPDGMPVLSVYADWRASGRGLHEARTVVRKELHAAAAAQPGHGPERASFEQDVARVLRFLEEEADPAARGLAVFACQGRGYWLPLKLGVPVATSVAVADTPRVLPLVEASQHAGRTVIAVVNTHELRLLLLDREGEAELGGLRRRAATIKHISSGGWLGVEFRRGMDIQIERFAAEASALIADALRERGADLLVVGGDEVIRGPLLAALPGDVRRHLAAVEHIDMRATPAEVAAQAWPLALAATEAAIEAEVAAVVSGDGARRAGRALDAAASRRALDEQLIAGLVDTVVIDPGAVGDIAAERWLRGAAARHATAWLTRDDSRVAERGGAVWTQRGAPLPA
jgi:hypothetical protein